MVRQRQDVCRLEVVSPRADCLRPLHDGSFCCHPITAFTYFNKKQQIERLLKKIFFYFAPIISQYFYAFGVILKGYAYCKKSWTKSQKEVLAKGITTVKSMTLLFGELDLSKPLKD